MNFPNNSMISGLLYDSTPEVLGENTTAHVVRGVVQIATIIRQSTPRTIENTTIGLWYVLLRNKEKSLR